jgi:putative methionine-R-sulfoxide reductase with GAF domain
MLNGDVLGELDIDSDRRAAFGQGDREMLERIAALLAPKLARSRQSL